MTVHPNDQLSFTVPDEQIIEWRRHMHAHPELSFKEVNTSQWVEDLLKEMGIETSRPTPTSVLGVLKGRGRGRPRTSVCARTWTRCPSGGDR